MTLDKAKAMLFGLAIGDALGASTVFLSLPVDRPPVDLQFFCNLIDGDPFRFAEKIHKPEDLD